MSVAGTEVDVRELDVVRGAQLNSFVLTWWAQVDEVPMRFSKRTLESREAASETGRCPLPDKYQKSVQDPI